MKRLPGHFADELMKRNNDNIRSGIIIAGGRSLRMGSDKALLLVGGRPLLVRLAEQAAALCGSVIIVVDGEERLERYQAVIEEYAPAAAGCVRIITDSYPGSGPLAGLEAGLSQLPNGYAFVTACDMPHMSAALLRRMAEYADGTADVVHAPGQPFHALYHTRTPDAARSMLDEGDFRFMRLFDRLRAVEVRLENEEEGQTFLNLNTPEAYARFVGNERSESQ